MLYEEQIPWIKNTPLGIRIRNIEFVPTHMHENIVEITLCLKGSVKFSYGFEEFTLSAGEFISVDKDAHFLYADNGDNVCVSYYIDLEWFRNKYPFITSLLFVCEATKESAKPYPTYYHQQMKGLLISILFCLSNQEASGDKLHDMIMNGTERIVDMLIDHFDIVFYYHPDLKLKTELMERNRKLMAYLQAHSTEKITLDSLANEFNLAKVYISGFLGAFQVGFIKSLNYMRVNNSEKLLLTTDLSIMEISEACGFSDPKYYYRAFKEWYKCTPKQFRKSYQEKMKKNTVERELDLNEVTKPLNEMMIKHYRELFLE